MLYDRLYHSLNLTSLPKPEFPFQRVDVQTPRDHNTKVDCTPQKQKIEFPSASTTTVFPSRPTGPQPVPPAQPGTTSYTPMVSQQPLGNYYTPGIPGPQTISYNRPAPPSTDHTAPVTHTLGTPNPVGVASTGPKPMTTPPLSNVPLTSMTTDAMASWNEEGSVATPTPCPSPHFIPSPDLTASWPHPCHAHHSPGDGYPTTPDTHTSHLHTITCAADK